MTFWKLERGGRVGTFDQVLGSTTITQAIMTQIQLRALNIVGALLVLLWALSPLGGQASLRIIGTAIEATETATTIRYINTTSPILDYEYDGADTLMELVPVDALFTAAMISPSTGQSAPVDAWGNFRVPWIEYLDSTTMGADGWYPVPETLSNDDYSSLIGMSMSAINDSANLTTTLKIETSYWVLDCSYLGSSTGNMTALLGGKSMNMDLLTSDSATRDTNIPRSIVYADNVAVDDDFSSNQANCTMQTSCVEVAVSCSEDQCTATDIRKSQKPYQSSGWTILDDPGFGGFIWFATAFVGALPTGHESYPSPYQNFIINPQKAYITTSISTKSVGTRTVAIRLGQLMNTYWMAMLDPAAVPQGLQNLNFTADANATEGTQQLSATATLTTTREVLTCDNRWLAVLVVSAAITAILGVCGLVATLCRRGPELGLNIAAMIKDSPFVEQSTEGSTLDASERSRLCKEIVVKYGDVKSDQEVGYISIGSATQGIHSVGTLKSRRLYE